MTRTRTVSLPEDLCEAAEQRLLHRFGSLDELVTTLLREMVRDEATVMDKHEQQVVEERLRALGYI